MSLALRWSSLIFLMRALIVELGSLGDVVMALSMIDALRARYGDVSISWLCRRSVAPLLEATLAINELIVVDDEKFVGGRIAKLLEAARTWFRLAGRRFDLVLVGNPDWRYRFLVLGVRARELRSFGGKEGRPFPIPGRYHGDEYIRLVTEHDGPRGWRGLQRRLTVSVPTSLERTIVGIESPLIALAPGGAKNILRDQPLKRWPLESYVQLAKILVARGHSVLVVGAASDAWVKDAFTKLGIVDLVGQTTVIDLVGLFGKCDLVVTHDSGPMHLAALAGVPIVALFGPTDPASFAPRAKNVRVIRASVELACRPCYDGSEYAKCSENVCMRLISVTEVLTAVDDLLAGRE
jgi:heptosyltransferase-2